MTKFAVYLFLIVGLYGKNLLFSQDTSLQLTIASFNKKQPLIEGGTAGSWNSTQENHSATCIQSIISKGVQKECLQIQYDVKKNRSYAGYWIKMNSISFSEFSKLHFFIRTLNPKSERIQLEIKNSYQEVANIEITNITQDWKEVTLFLDDIKDITDWDSITELVFICAHSLNRFHQGTFEIDEISVS